jgi:hypothetical protein
MGDTLKTVSILAVFVAVTALAVTPAFAVGPPSDTPDQNDNPGVTHQPSDTPPDNQGTEHKPATPGPRAGLPAKARAYGRFCKDESKKRSDAAEGTKGTPFSQCVTAMAKLAKGQRSSPRAACKALSKKHSDAAEGTKGTPFSQCVAGGAKLLREQKAQNEE